MREDFSKSLDGAVENNLLSFSFNPVKLKLRCLKTLLLPDNLQVVSCFTPVVITSSRSPQSINDAKH